MEWKSKPDGNGLHLTIVLLPSGRWVLGATREIKDDRIQPCEYVKYLKLPPFPENPYCVPERKV